MVRSALIVATLLMARAAIAQTITFQDVPLPQGIREQTEVALRNMVRVLEGLGLSLARVVRVRIVLTHFKRDYAAMNEVYADFFPANARPARTCVGVTDLVRDALIEIDCVARR